MLKNKKIQITIILLLISNVMLAQMTSVVGNSNPTALAQKLAGPGVTVTNATFNGNCDSAVSAGEFVATPNTVFGLDSGIILSSGNVVSTGTTFGVNSLPPGSTPGQCGQPQFASAATNGGSDADLVILGGNVTINNACMLEFDFVPLGDSVKFEYVFGSEEYDIFNCSINDVFGFFISGPGITGPYSSNSTNIAIVPTTTNIPVAISTINNGLNPGPPCQTNTNNNGPYTQYYVSNIDSFNNTIVTDMTYTGFTITLTAESQVIPCSTYHLKLGVGDASDQVYDSGVFLKAGSLTSNSVSFQPLSALNDPQPYVVEGCAAGLIKISRANPTPNAYTVNYGIGGNAINGTDYNNLSGSVTIPANDTVAYINIAGIADNVAEGQESLIIYQYAPCTTNVVDSVEILISDNYIASIITNDTTICAEDSVLLQISGDDSLTYSWSPLAGVASPNDKNTMVSPNVTTAYVATMTYPQAGCPILYDTVTVTIRQQPDVNIGNDSVICQNMSIAFNPIVTPNQQYTYSWSGSGAAFLSATNISNPIGNFTQQGVFDLILNVDPSAIGCEGFDTITIEVIPDDITMLTQDTIICKGEQVNIQVDGHPYFTYNWTPTTYLNNPTLEDPIATPDTTITYTVVANFPGCNPMTKDLDIEVQPVPTIDAGLNREMCDYDTIQLQATVDPAWYNSYSYAWSPASELIGDTTDRPVFIGRQSGTIQLIVSTPIGCSDTDNVFIEVHPVEFNVTSPEEVTICPRDSIQFTSVGAISYFWEPNLYLNDNTIANPVANPPVPIEYTIYANSIHGCTDTDVVKIQIAPNTVLDAGDDVTIYPGESHQMNPQGNASLFTWFPPYALSSTSLSNPIATPEVSTLYFVTGQTEFGCDITDSIYVRVSAETILDLPNAFSPGSGTSINDRLTIKKRGIATLEYFQIFNRWGEKIWETRDIDDGWDGRYNGKPQPMGAYVYLIKARTSTGKIFNKQGTVTLIR